MLHSQNCGKYLTQTYEQERERCAWNKDRYTTADQAFYEISGQSPGMGDRERLEETFTSETTPVDIRTTPKRYDIRDCPQVGH
jgi:hypothetical protein